MRRFSAFLGFTVLYLAGIASVPAQQTPPSYHVSAIIPQPDNYSTNGSWDPVAMNAQGYLLFAGTSSHPAPLVYFNGALHDLPLLPNGNNGVVSLSNVAPDGSLWVLGSFAEDQSIGGRTRPMTWQVLADGFAEIKTYNNLHINVSPEEQGTALGYAINSSGLIVGYGQSFLADALVTWQAPNPEPSRVDTGYGAFGAFTVVDEAGRYGGDVSDLSTHTPYFNTVPLFVNQNGFALNGAAGNRVAGSYRSNLDNRDRAFVADLNTPGGAADRITLPDPPSTSTTSYNSVAKSINASGDALGTAGSDGNPTVWTRNADTGAYTAQDIKLYCDRNAGTIFAGTGLIYGNFSYQAIGLAADGSLAFYRLLYRTGDPNTGSTTNAVAILTPGADPRPFVTSPLEVRASLGRFLYQITATNHPTAFQAVGSYGEPLPPGLSFDPATGTLSGTLGQLGVYRFTVSATNGQGIGAAPADVVLSVGDLPEITSALTASANKNQPFSYQITATNSPSNFSAFGLPAGLSADYNTGLIEGTPTESGTFTVTLQVQNPLDFSTATLTLTVDDKPPAAFAVSLVKPKGDVSVVEGSTLVAKARVDLSSAGGETVASVQFLLDGQPIGSALSAKPYKASLFLDASRQGTHQLTARATGNDGRVAFSAPLRVSVAPAYVDLTGTASLSSKLNAKGKLVIKGAYSLSNLGNAPAGSFAVKFYLSDDTSFDAATDEDLAPLIRQFVGKDTVPNIVIPGLPANTTLSTADVDSLLPPIKVAIPGAALSVLGLSGKYVLVVLDPANAVGEDDSARANNVIAIRLP